MVKKWRERSSSRSNSPQSEGESPLTQSLQFKFILFRWSIFILFFYRPLRRIGKSVYSKLSLDKSNIDNQKDSLGKNKTPTKSPILIEKKNSYIKKESEIFTKNHFWSKAKFNKFNFNLTSFFLFTKPLAYIWKSFDQSKKN